MLRKKLVMPLLLVTLVALMGSSINCAAKHMSPMPEPIYGKDIIRVSENQVVPFNGTLFSDFYLNSYLQWKDDGK